jgi:hypothetical protein
MNYEHLEESLTLDELMATYEAQFEQERRTMEWQAKIQGVDVKDSGSDNEQADAEPGSLADRLRQRKQQQAQDSGKPAESIFGTGYETIGG